MQWDERPLTQKGTLGETILDRYIRDHKFIPYHAVFDGSHPFDRICISPNKTDIFIGEVKTKARRTYYPDTGIDMRHYNGYKKVSEKYNLRVFIFFVDESVGKVYGNYLHLLEAPTLVEYNNKTLSYPLIQKEIIYFPLQNMKPICDIDDKDVIKLKELSKRSYPYLE